MASVTCRLTAEDWDHLRNRTLVSAVGLPYHTWLEITAISSRGCDVIVLCYVHATVGECTADVC